MQKAISMQKELNMQERLIVALDFPTQQAALEVVSNLEGLVDFFKVGLQLFTAGGPSLIRELKERGCKIFLDLKFHDIPNTVANAVTSACSLGVEFLSVHASGGKKMLEAACHEVKSFIPPEITPGTEPERVSEVVPKIVPECGTKILAITTLTSLTDNDIKDELRVSVPLSKYVLDLALMAKEAGCHGIVASGKELLNLKEHFGKSFIFVVPGIRPSASLIQQDDQARIITPKDAIKGGADFLVVGRPIISATNPKEAAYRIISEMKEAKAI